MITLEIGLRELSYNGIGGKNPGVASLKSAKGGVLDILGGYYVLLVLK